MTQRDTPVRATPWNYGMLSSAELGDREREYVLNVLDKKRLFRYLEEGAETSEALRLEEFYKELLGVRHCLAVNSGTSALVAALIAAGVGPGDEVIIPAYTYVATAAAVMVARAVPVIVEVDDTLTIDPCAIEEAITPSTKAIMPVHMRGVPCQMDDIMSIAGKHGLLVIEDNAQANGGTYHGKRLGTFGDVGCFSFQQHKLVTAGEGGMFVTNNERMYERAAVYHDSSFVYWGMNKKRDYEFFPGENYRVSELHAAIALAQSERLDSIVGRLQQIKRKIVDGIRDVEAIRLQRIPDEEGDVSYSLVFYLPSPDAAEEFSASLNREGIPSGTAHRQATNGFPDRHIYKNWSYIMEKRGISERDNPWNSPHYKGSVEYSVDMCPRTLELLGNAVSIILHQRMSDEDCDDVVRAVHKVAARLP